MDTNNSLMPFYNQPRILIPDETSGELSKKLFCSRDVIRTSECINNSVLDCSVTFSCDRNICVYGIQVI